MGRRLSLATVMIFAAVAVAQGAAGTQALTSLAPQVAGVTDLAGDLRNLAGEYRRGEPVAGQLARTMQLAGGSFTIQPAAPVSFPEALTAFYRAAGVSAARITAPPAPVADAMAPLIAALANGVTLTREALAQVTPAERRWALQHLDSFEVPGTTSAAKVGSIAARIDLPKMRQAALDVAAAIDGLPPLTGPQSSWVDVTGAIEIGSTGNDTYSTDRVLRVDLGGSDTYTDSAGAIGPGIYNTLGLPVSINVDLGGNDVYTNLTPNQAENTVVAQGSGLGGVGLLVDRWGNDSYVADLFGSNYSQSCVSDPLNSDAKRYPQVVHAQGVGALGVGGLIDLGGDDTMWAISVVNTPNDCHFNRSYVFAQGAGLHKGVGVLIDDLGNDYRYLHS